jgi:hypothetical protein
MPKVYKNSSQLLFHDLVQHRPRALGDFELNKDIAENLQKLVRLETHLLVNRVC